MLTDVTPVRCQGTGQESAHTSVDPCLPGSNRDHSKFHSRVTVTPTTEVPPGKFQPSREQCLPLCRLSDQAQATELRAPRLQTLPSRYGVTIALAN